MSVREIKTEDIKVGAKVIHKGYSPAMTDMVRTIISIGKKVDLQAATYDSGGWDFVSDILKHYNLVGDNDSKRRSIVERDLVCGATIKNGNVEHVVHRVSNGVVHYMDGCSDTLNIVLDFFEIDDGTAGIPTFDGDIATHLGVEVGHIDERDLIIDYTKAICLVPTSVVMTDDYILFKDEVYLVRDSSDPLKYIVQLNGGRTITANKDRFELVGRKEDLPQGTKLDQGKLKPTLLLDDMPLAINEILKVLQFGSEKYSEGNWLKVPNGIDRYRNAADRHRLAVDELDDESGMMHLAHEATSVLMLLELKLREKRDAE